MNVCLSHMTALHYLLRNPNLRVGPSRRPSRAASVPTDAPCARDAGELAESLRASLRTDGEPLEVLVSTSEGRSAGRAVHAHLCTAELPVGSFVAAESYGRAFHVSSPELVFLQLASILDEVRLAYVGCALCSDFLLDDLAAGGCCLREGADAALTSVAGIGAYLSRVPSGTRGLAHARRALPRVLDGARSPREIGIALALGLPARLGGRALGDVRMNRAIRVYDGQEHRGGSRWLVRIPDVTVSSVGRDGVRRCVGIDYDPWSTHGDTMRAQADIERRNLLVAADGLVHFTLGSAQVENYVAFSREADRIRRALRVREKPQLPRAGSSKEADDLRREVDHRRFELWRAVLCGARVEL